MSKLSGAICMAIVVAVQMSFADWSWSGKSGNVTIPSGTTASVLDADVPTVSALTGLTIESGATLSFENGTVACTLGYPISGSGAITATSAATITLGGDNRAFTGTKLFDQTPVTVTSRYGLGAASVVATVKAGRLLFKGNGLTNDVPLVLYGNRSGATTLAESSRDPLVLNGLVTIYDLNNITLGDWHFNAGIDYKGSSLSIGLDGEAWILGGPLTVGRINSYVINGVGGTAIHIAQRAGAWPTMTLSGGMKFYCEGENVLPYDRGVKFGDWVNIDLQGHNQTTWYLIHNNNKLPTSNYGCYVRSADPAVIEMTEAGESVLQFLDAAGFTKSGTGTYILRRSYSETTGQLSVTGGAIVLADGAGWAGDVSVSDGAKLELYSGTSLNRDGKSEISMTGTGVLALSNGVAVVCAKLTVDGIELPEDTYTACAQNPWLEGEGSVTVHVPGKAWIGGATGNWSESGNWEGGLPTGGRVSIPEGCTVTVDESAIASVESVSGIDLAGTLSFGNASELVLTADLMGTGTLTATGAGGITLAGDSRLFTGAKMFDNTPVTVTSRYALGDSNVVATVKYARLLFKGEGLTNDVPLVLYGGRTGATQLTENLSDPLVLNGLVTLYDSVSPAAMNITFGDWRFNGGIDYKGGNWNASLGGEVWILGPLTVSRINNYVFNGVGGTAIHMAGRAGQWPTLKLQGGMIYYCESENVISYDRGVNFGDWVNIDLQGHNQTTWYMIHNNDTLPKSNYGCYVRSAEPAYVEMTEGGRSVLQFLGAAGLKKSGNGTYELHKSRSTTTGLLSVTSGAVALVEGAAWYGDVSLSGAGILNVDADSCLEAFGPNRGKDSTTILSIADSAYLDLAAASRVKELYVNGKKMSSGRYASEDSTIAGVKKIPQLRGEGVLTVGNLGLAIILR